MKGLIVTDTYVLAQKLRVTQYELQCVLQHYMAETQPYIQWYLVDVADPMYDDVIKLGDWRTYASVLSDYYYGLGMNEEQNCPLFIIGGNEEIPMPQIENPALGLVGREYLYSDMAYCYDFSTQPTLNYDIFLNQTPRLAVGRLPISEQHDMSYLVRYLEKCAALMPVGIHVRGSAMITTESWLPASTEMMRGIPVATLDNDYVPLNSGMIVSPLLDTEYAEMYDGYVHELRKVDCLVCNLHGSDKVGRAHFLGENKERTFSTTATQPSMLLYYSPVIFNTAACFGARYINYDIQDSMLYTALECGTMLYTGSCDIALGKDNGGYSELFLKLYTIYLHQGLPAGWALIKAKIDYYRTCHIMDDDAGALYTMLEFNLFGCPALAMRPTIETTYRPTLLGNHVVEKSRSSYCPKKYETVSTVKDEIDGLLSYVRGLVDTNFAYIRNKVERYVYEQLGLSTNQLDRIHRVSQNNIQMGWQFIYQWTPQESYREFTFYYIVETDEQGEITKVIHTK